MPIRKSERARYPENWRAVRARILVRAERRCECAGECGDPHSERCSAPNRKSVVRPAGAPWDWRFARPGEQVPRVDGRVVQVVLTVAHLDHVPEHCDDENLRALCQRCHLRLDRHQHGRNAAATRRAARGTLDLFAGPGVQSIAFFIGDVCNAECVMCWQALRRGRTDRVAWYKEMRAEVVEAVLARHERSLVSVELISFGEPMINPAFGRMARTIARMSASPERERPLLFNITTNGSLVHRHRAVLATPGYLTFSIDAAEEGLYERIRVGLDWGRVSKNFTEACQHPARHPERFVGIAVTVFEDNADQVVPVARMVVEAGGHFLCVLHGAKLDASAAAGREILPTDPRLVEGIDEARRLFPALTVNDYATGRAPLLLRSEAAPARAVCPLPWQQFDVGPDGRAHPCCRSYGTDLGDVLADDVWNGEPYTELRRQILADDVDPVRFAACAACPLLGAGVRGATAAVDQESR